MDLEPEGLSLSARSVELERSTETSCREINDTSEKATEDKKTKASESPLMTPRPTAISSKLPMMTLTKRREVPEARSKRS